MGMYVNPPTMGKEAWLYSNGSITSGPCAITESHLPVCLVNNGPFTAAGVGDSQREVEAFNQHDDPRPKLWFSVSRESLRTIGLDV